MGDIRVSQVATEAVTPQAAAPDERVSQVVAEVVTPQAIAPEERVSQVVVEAVTPQIASVDLRVSQVVVEAVTPNRIFLPAIPSGSTLFPPSLVPGVVLAFIPSGTTLFPPSLVAFQAVTTGTIPSGTALFPPAVAVVAVDVSIRITQAGAESAISGGPSAFRVTQGGVELAYVSESAFRATQGGVEVAYLLDTALRITQAGAEIAYTPATTELRLTQAGIEVVYVLQACRGGGTIIVVDDPPDGEVFVGRTLSPRYWTTLGYDGGDRSFAPDSYNHRPTYYGGRKHRGRTMIVGLACPYLQWSDVELHHGEHHRFMPGCFAPALARQDSKLYVDHDHSQYLASTADGTLQLWEDAAGLMFEAHLTMPASLLTGITCCVEAVWNRGGIPVTPHARFSITKVMRLHISLLDILDPSFSGTWVKTI